MADAPVFISAIKIPARGHSFDRPDRLPFEPEANTKLHRRNEAGRFAKARPPTIELSFVPFVAFPERETPQRKERE
ncbi:hypothetical protein CFBP4996_03065 [Agrobacterium leguminum]|uniref:Uncharacterized protein n=1 Tax=Agrobacterium deltaense NCPPB 1641 TaxID=1183425 RepID=A0A1S7TMT7_9HYPH|nr:MULTISPECIES: hypothetical protein [Agrobacterium]WFS66289.1 hypothetical protein CFBP4996_03065 [Agrobacterium leguminum]CVI55902.1 hypothetical protein AGR7A_Cc240044 [Agrobacterium deltaense NCPPB 1641]